ncbi:MAG: hypothetical protein JNK22_16285 [Rhodocyclaceae bacterium]|nr:hypothetical protein [Rhodocyclaceae bacterium]
MDKIDGVVVVLDKLGVILLVNQGWWDFANKNRLPDGTLARGIEVGANYLDACRTKTDDPSATAALALDGLRAVLAGKSKCFRLEYPCHHGDRRQWFRMTARPLRSARPAEMVVSHVDITDRKLAELALVEKQTELARALAEMQTLTGRIAYMMDEAGPRLSGGAAPRTSPSGGRAAKGGRAAALDALSKREREVLNGIVSGERNTDIAARLALSPKTVSTYQKRLFEKLDVGSVSQLVALVTNIEMS